MQTTCTLQAPTLLDLNYELFDSASEFSSELDEFLCTTNCEEVDQIDYEMSISPYASLLTTDGRHVDWSNAVATDIGTYTIEVVAKVDSQAASCNITASFNLTIVNSATSDITEVSEVDAPYFSTDPN